MQADAGPSMALDTNVLVYAFDRDPAKAAVAERLLATKPFISVQALNELVNVLRRKRALSWPEISEVVETVSALCRVIDLTLDTHRIALALVRRYSLGWWDALQLAAALYAGVDEFMTEDLQAGLQIESRLRVVNPFLA